MWLFCLNHKLVSACVGECTSPSVCLCACVRAWQLVCDNIVAHSSSSRRCSQTSSSTPITVFHSHTVHCSSVYEVEIKMTKCSLTPAASLRRVQEVFNQEKEIDIWGWLNGPEQSYPSKPHCANANRVKTQLCKMLVRLLILIISTACRVEPVRQKPSNLHIQSPPNFRCSCC